MIGRFRTWLVSPKGTPSRADTDPQSIQVAYDEKGRPRLHLAAAANGGRTFHMVYDDQIDAYRMSIAISPETARRMVIELSDYLNRQVPGA